MDRYFSAGGFPRSILAKMVEIVPPYFSNLGKRLVKAPKVYGAEGAQRKER
jgi:predicted AAA+ superfamily ATPase